MESEAEMSWPPTWNLFVLSSKDGFSSLLSAICGYITSFWPVRYGKKESRPFPRARLERGQGRCRVYRLHPTARSMGRGTFIFRGSNQIERVWVPGQPLRAELP